jgi:protocatechuate 3,4-dioxygenase beta subunit
MHAGRAMTRASLDLRPLLHPTRRRFCRLCASVLVVPAAACGTGGGTTSPQDGDTSEGGTQTEPGGSSGPGAGSSDADASSSAGGSSSDATGSADVDGDTTAGSSSDAGSDDTAADTGSVCTPTDSDIEGPFYRPGIPIGGNLDVHGDPGIPLVLSGRVLDEGCQPLAAAVVEIWHATPVAPGAEPGDVLADYDQTRAYRYYGQVATDADGRYGFTTLKPGWYLNGAAYRPAHVHVKVWVGDRERLTTQLYFVGDPFNAEDPWFNPDLALDPDAAGKVELDLVV